MKNIKSCIKTIVLFFAATLISFSVGAYELVLPSLDYRTGPYAPNGIPIANGYTDYLRLLNERDGGINGVRIKHVSCETGYNTKVGVECYEKVKNTPPSGALAIQPLSTGITYQLIPKAAVDQIPIFSMGYGRTSAANGKVFPWIFNFPATYWSQASAVINYIGSQEGGLGNLKGKHIAHVYHNSAYGKEANPTLDALSTKLGFKLTKLAVDHPGQEQKATWLQIRRKKPDWVFMSGWGVMNQVAIKEAASIGFPMNKFIGNWWSASDADVIPAGDNAIGYKGTNMHPAGTKPKVIQEIIKHIYGGDMAKAKENKVGEVLYNRAVLGAFYATEVVRDAVKAAGGKKPNGDQVREAFENLNMSPARLEKSGMKGYSPSFKVSCRNHEGDAPGALIQQWDGSKWTTDGKFYSAMSDVVRPMVEKAAAAYAKENKITPKDC